MFPRVFNPGGMTPILQASVDLQTGINKIARAVRGGLEASDDVRSVSAKGCDTLLCVVGGKRFRVTIEQDS